MMRHEPMGMVMRLEGVASVHWLAPIRRNG